MLRISSILILLLISPILSASEPSMSPYHDCDAATKAVVDHVIDAMGGVQRVDSVTNFHFIRHDVLESAQSKETVDLDALVVFPDSVRAHIKSSGGEMTLVVSPESDFMIDPEAVAGAAIRINSDERDVLLRNVYADPLVVLRLRSKYSVLFGLEKPISDEKRTLDVLRIDIRQQQLRWFVDRQTGRIVRATVGSVDRDLSDWRTVGGLTLPFAAEEWTPEHKLLGRSTYQRAEMNLLIDADALFRTPTLWVAHLDMPPARDDQRTRVYIVPSSQSTPSRRVVLPNYSAKVYVDYVAPVYVPRVYVAPVR